MTIYYKKGDRIKLIYKFTNLGAPKGSGTIMKGNKNNSGVCIAFDTSFPRGHTCEGTCQKNTGWWVNSSRISLEQPNWKARLSDQNDAE